MKKILIFLLLWVSCLSISATNYYVKSGGNDAAAGTSDGTAWAHHPWMSTWTGSVTLVPGDVVYMKRGDTWIITVLAAPYMTVGQSGTAAGGYITTTAYGTGEKPIIWINGDYSYPVISGLGMSYVIFDNLEIRGYNHVYAASSAKQGIVLGKSGTVSHNWIITNCDIHNFANSGIVASGDSYQIVIGDSTATSCATTSSYSNHIYDCGYAGIAMGGCNPTTLRSDFKIYYNYIDHIDFDDAVARDGYGVAFAASSASTQYPKYVYVRYNRVEYVKNWHGIDAHGGQYLYFQNNYIYACRGALNAFAADRGVPATIICDHVYITDNTVEMPGNHPTTYYYGIIVMAENNSYPATNCYVQRNTIFYTTRPTSEGASWGVCLYGVIKGLIEKNVIYNGTTGTCSGGIYLGASGFTTDSVTVQKNWIKDWSFGIGFRLADVHDLITVQNNIIFSHNRAVGSSYTASATGKYYFYNNVILTNPSGSLPHPFAWYYVTLPVGSSMTVKNNIIGYSAATTSTYYIRNPQTISGTLTYDYNLYWNNNYSAPFYSGAAFLTLAQWKAAGYDAHTPNTTSSLNPVLTNTSGNLSDTLDYALQTISPAIDAGTDVGITSDFFNKIVPNNLPDIGASEYYPINPPDLPTVETEYPLAIKSTYFHGIGTVTDDGGATVTERGICYGLTSDPTTLGSHVAIGSGTGEFDLFYIGGLKGNTLYYVRAYAINSAGTAYGDNVTFTTPSVTYMIIGGKALVKNKKLIVR